MALLKCKMCGGDLQIATGVSVTECEYCGTRQTVPKADDEKKITLFARAGRLRAACEFDKAAGIYESIVADFPEEAEAYWGLVLCKYGIEYVDDPATDKKVPTCHRSSFESVMEDSDFEQAVENADGIARRVYREEAKTIESLRKGIIAVSANEQPYDIFICYKETAENGERTLDSVLAQDIYDTLTGKGYRVFFSRISLEDKLGQEYEPYIFAALNSAKIMLAFGTDYDYFNAVWVKNEWGRFLKLMAKDKTKHLIPCYKGIDAYDLPKEFAKLQAQDLGKVGATQDLLRGIEKLLPRQAQSVEETVVMQPPVSGANTATLLKRAFMFLEDGNWASADEYCEKVLDIDPECAQAYLGKLMVELKVKKQESLKDRPESFAQNGNYQKALRFGDEKLKKALTGYIDHINSRNEQARLAEAYRVATVKTNSAKTEQEYIQAAYMYEKIGAYKNAASMAKSCREQAERERKDAIYQGACTILSDTHQWQGKQTDIKAYENAIVKLQSLDGWKDADAQIEICKQKIQQLKVKEEADRLEQKRQAELTQQEEARKAKRKQKVMIIAVSCVVAIIVFVVVLFAAIIPGVKYNKAVALMEEGKHAEAASVFYNIISYKDSGSLIKECRYQSALTMKDAGNYAEAAIKFGQLGNYKDAKEQSRALWDQIAVRETVSAGDHHTAGLKKDGTVIAVGSNLSDQCEVDPWTDIIAVSAGGVRTMGLKNDGTVMVADTVDLRIIWQDVVAISAGCTHAVGLKADGTVVGMGTPSDGQLETDDWKDIVAISAGYNFTAGLKADGTVVAVGDNGHGACNVNGWTDIVAISAGDCHTVGLKADGSVVATNWIGGEYSGQCDVSGWTDIVAISAGSFHTVGLKADGTVVALGRNVHGQCDVSDWTDIVAISAGRSHTVGLKADGTVVATRYPGDLTTYYDGQCDVDDWTNIKVPE